MAAGYRCSVGDLRTGKITRPVELTGVSWSVPLGEPGSIDGSYPLRAINPLNPLALEAVKGDVRPRPLWPTARSDTAAGKAFLLVEYENEAGERTAIEAGPIWKSKYVDSTGVLSIGASGLGSYFDHRKVMKVLAEGEDPADGDPPTYTAKQLGLIAKRLVELSQSHTGGHLPIVLPPDSDFDGTGEDIEKVYPGYELAWVGDRLRQLTEDERGPEIQFVPRRREDDERYIEWVMQIGTAKTKNLLIQEGDPWAWTRDPDVPKSALREIDINSDATKMAFRQWGAGQGEAEGRPIRKADALDLVTRAGFALLEGEVTAIDSEADDEAVQGYVNAAVAYSQRPIESWTATVSRDSNPKAGRYRPGHWARIPVRGHDFLPDNNYDMRILSIAGAGDSDAVTVVLSERLGDI